jgi:hypothetical protein
MITERERLQNAVDWNIAERDSAKQANKTRAARRYQRNIDKLNQCLAAL